MLRSEIMTTSDKLMITIMPTLSSAWFFTVKDSVKKDFVGFED